MSMGAGSPRANFVVATLAIVLMLPAVLAEEASSPTGSTINVTDVPVRDLIQNLASANGVGVVLTDAVQGTVSLSVKGQPFEELLKTICKAKGLIWTRYENGIYSVTSPEPPAKSNPEPVGVSRASEHSRKVTKFMYLGWWDCYDMAYLFDGITTPRTPGLTGAVGPIYSFGIGPVTGITELTSPTAQHASATAGLMKSPGETAGGQGATGQQPSSRKPIGVWEQLLQYQYPSPYAPYTTPGVTAPGVTRPGAPTTGEAGAYREPLTSLVPGAYGPLAPLLPEGLLAPPIAFLPLNALIVMGVDEEAIREFRELIAQLDVKVRQVNVEVQLVSVSLQEVQAWGLEWQWVGGNTTIGTVGMASSGATIAIGYSRTNLLANLQAAVISSRARVIQAFSVTAINNFPATIFTSSSFPIITSTAFTTPGALGGVAQTTSATNIQYLTIPSQFSVTPRINADDTITAFLTPVFTTIGPSVDLPEGGSIPQISAQTASSLVRVKDGETFVMGGTLVKNWTKAMRKIPFLSDIPLIGPLLFTSTSISQSEDEVFFFVTPRIQEEETLGAPTATIIP